MDRWRNGQPTMSLPLWSFPLEKQGLALQRRCCGNELGPSSLQGSPESSLPGVKSMGLRVALSFRAPNLLVMELPFPGREDTLLGLIFWELTDLLRAINYLYFGTDFELSLCNPRLRSVCKNSQRVPLRATSMLFWHVSKLLDKCNSTNISMTWDVVFILKWEPAGLQIH